MENSKNSSLSKLIPVMLCFFAMGFVDLVGIASNYVKVKNTPYTASNRKFHCPLLACCVMALER